MQYPILLQMEDGSYKQFWLSDEKLQFGGETDVPVKSISVNGTDVTPDTNGDVALPLANAYGKFGLFQIFAGNGIVLSASQASMYLDIANNGQVDDKNPGEKLLTTSRLDRAIRAGLLSNSQITASDYPAIHRTLGIGGDFELIINETLTERVGNLSYRATMNGEPLTGFSAFMILIHAMQDTTAGSYDTYLEDDSGNIFCSAAQQSLISASNDSVARIGFALFHNIWVNFENKCSTSNTWYGNTYAQHTRRDIESFGIGSKCSSILFANRNAGSLAVGTTIKIYGVRA